MRGLSAVERSLVEPIDGRSMLDLVLDWTGINSGTRNLQGLSSMAARLAEAFAVLPGEVELVEPGPVAEVGLDGTIDPVAFGRHLVVRVRSDARRRILLSGHMDTVFASTHPFQHWQRIDAATLRGPGTADMKGGIAVMLAGLAAFEATCPALGYDVLINSDEEAGSPSSAGLIENLAEQKLAALTYEPSLPGGLMARARPASGNFSAIVSGRSAHAGRNPEAGRNAIVAAADLALRLQRAARDGISVNPARIDGGGPNNLVPDLAILRFNVRARGRGEMAEAQARIDAAISAVAREHDVSLRLNGGFGRPPKAITQSGRTLFAMIAAAGEVLGEKLDWTDTGGVCDGNNIAACGVPVVDTMGVRGGQIHSDQEFLLIDSLAERARLTAVVLHRIDRQGLSA